MIGGPYHFAQYCLLISWQQSGGAPDAVIPLIPWISLIVIKMDSFSPDCSPSPSPLSHQQQSFFPAKPLQAKSSDRDTRQTDCHPSLRLLGKFAQSCVSFSTTVPGRLIGSFTLKNIAGVLIGLGCAGTFAGAAGVPLIIVGVTLFWISTMVSVAARIDEGSGAVAKHVCISVLVGATGVSGPFIPLIPINLFAVPGIAAALATVSFCGSILIDISMPCGQKPEKADQHREQVDERQATAEQITDNIGMPKKITDSPPSDQVKSEIRQIIEWNLMQLKKSDGFKLSAGLFYLTSAGTDYFSGTLFSDDEGSTEEWCAEKTSYSHGDYYRLITSHSADQLLLSGRGSSQDWQIIRGQELLDLLNEAEES